jgi:hypothetical protein
MESEGGAVGGTKPGTEVAVMAISEIDFSDKAWFKKQRNWGLIFGTIGGLLMLFPGTQVAGAVVTGVGVLVFGKGASDAISRTETAVKATESIAMSNAVKLAAVESETSKVC